MRCFAPSDKFEIMEQADSQFFQYVSNISENTSRFSPSSSKKPINEQKLHQFLASIYNSKRNKNTSSINFYTPLQPEIVPEQKPIQKIQFLEYRPPSRIKLPSMPKVSNKKSENKSRPNVKKVSIVLAPNCCVKQSEEILESMLVNKPKVNKIQQKYRFQFNGRIKSLESSEQSLVETRRMSNWTEEIPISKPLHKLSVQMRVNRLKGIRCSRNRSTLINTLKGQDKDKIMIKRSQTPNIQLKPSCIGIREEEKTIQSPPPSGKYKTQFINRKRRLQKFRVKM